VTEQLINGTSAQYRLCSAIILKLQKEFAIYNTFKNNRNTEGHWITQCHMSPDTSENTPP